MSESTFLPRKRLLYYIFVSTNDRPLKETTLGVLLLPAPSAPSVPLF
jgi:hypothetical protein